MWLPVSDVTLLVSVTTGGYVGADQTLVRFLVDFDPRLGSAQ